MCVCVCVCIYLTHREKKNMTAVKAKKIYIYVASYFKIVNFHNTRFIMVPVKKCSFHNCESYSI